jgi:hypothetical protein
MGFDWQAVVAGSCVALSAAWLARRAIGMAKHDPPAAGPCGNCQGCGTGAKKNDGRRSAAPTVVEISTPIDRRPNG